MTILAYIVRQFGSKDEIKLDQIQGQILIMSLKENNKGFVQVGNKFLNARDIREIEEVANEIEAPDGSRYVEKRDLTPDEKMVQDLFQSKNKQVIKSYGENKL